MTLPPENTRVRRRGPSPGRLVLSALTALLVFAPNAAAVSEPLEPPHESTIAPAATDNQPEAVIAAGFTDALVAAVGSPSALAFTPDGRMLVATQPGQLRVIKNGSLLGTPAINLAARMCSNSERGLLGVAVDPQFATNRFIYLFWTVKVGTACPRLTAAAPVNRVSRFVLPASNVISPTTEVVLIDNVPSPGGNHNGGDLGFGKDGYLYVSIGDGGCDYAGNSGCGALNDASRDRNVLLGKVLRIDRNGAVPATNPFATTGGRCNATGRTTAGQHCQETFARGLRNPFRMGFDGSATATRFFINDVGQDTWEEVNLGTPGADYGWNVREGGCVTGSLSNCGPPPSGMTNPIWSYAHDEGCSSITGAAFVPSGVWPAEYSGSYLYGDYVCGSIFVLTPSTGGFARTTLASDLGTGSAVHLAFGPFGTTKALYYTSYAGGGQVRRISYTGSSNRAPVAVLAASPTAGATPLTVAFDGSGSFDPDGDPLVYRWTFGDGTDATETSSPQTSHVYSATGTFSATLQVRDPSGATSPDTTVSIIPGNRPPVVTITGPAPGRRYSPGQAVTLKASATDPDTGPVPGTALRWVIIRTHDTHTHPFLSPPAGAQVGITYPDPESPNDTTSFLSATVTATDPSGATTSQTIDLRPKDTLVIDDVAIVEGVSGRREVTVPVTLQRQVCSGVCSSATVTFSTVAGSAAAGSDFVATSGTLTFGPTETSKVIRVRVRGDAIVEPDERFTLRLSNPSASASLRDATAEVLILADETSPTLPIRVNVGGGRYTDTSGAVWSADRGSTGGQITSVTAAIAGTTDGTLYHSERFGHSGYHLVVPNGTYRVRLHFAEVSACCTAVGHRVFSVAAEGSSLLSSFDILAEVARNTALVKEATVAVTDGVLDVTFSPIVQYPKLSAIEVLPAGTAYDLVVTTVTTTPAAPASGATTSVSVTIKNIGTAPTPDGIIHGVSFRVDGVLTNWSDTHTTSLAPGQTVTLTANGGPAGTAAWTATPGSHIIEAFVDNTNRMPNEANESNNKRQLNLTVS